MRFCNLFKKRLKILFLLSSSFLVPLKSRSLFTPLPYTNLPYVKDLYRQSMPSLEGLEEENSAYEVYPSMMLYNRSTDLAYDNCDRYKTNDLAALFHGRDKFYLKDTFENSSIITTSDFAYSDRLADVRVNPSYSYNEDGCILGISAQREKEINCRTWNVRVHAHLPVKSIEVKNEKGYESLNFDCIKLPNELLSSYVKLDGANGDFAMRLDKAIESDFLKFSPGEKYFVTGAQSEIVGNPGSETNNDLGQISLEFANQGFANWSGDNAGQDIYLLKVTSIIDPNDPVQVNGTANAVVKNNIFSFLFYSLGADDSRTVLPYNLYKDTSAKKLPATSSSNKYYVDPKKIENDSEQTMTDNVFYNDNGDGKYTDINDIVNVFGPLPAGEKINLYGVMRDNRDLMGPNQKPVEFTVPVLLKKSEDGFPETFGSNLTLAAHDVSNYGEGEYWFNDYRDITQTQAFYYLENDGTLKESNIVGPFPEDAPIIFWYGTDYSNLKNAGNLDQYYVVPSLDGENLTSESAAIRSEITNTVLNQSNGVQEKLSNVELGRMFIEGFFKGSKKNISDTEDQYCRPINKDCWDDYKKVGVGDFDLEVSFGTQFCDNKFSADLILGAIVPTAEIINHQEKYLATSLGNNGHWEFRLGTQAAYDVNNWIRLSGYLHGSAALCSRENLVASFKNATAFGLQPVTVDADVSWRNIVASFDLSCFANEWTSVSMKYQFYYKTKDCIQPCQKTIPDGLDNLSAVSFSNMRSKSDRLSHKIIGNISGAINSDVYLSLGASTVFAGKNIGQESDLFLTATISY